MHVIFLAFQYEVYGRTCIKKQSYVVRELLWLQEYQTNVSVKHLGRDSRFNVAAEAAGDVY
jgi:hypothetical protein